MTELRQVFRALARTPFVTAAAILSLALGVGANTALFSIFEQVVLRSVPAEDPGSLVNLAAPGPRHASMTSCGFAGSCDEVFSYPMFRDLEREQTALAGLAAHENVSVNLSFENQPRTGAVILVSGSYFPLLGLRPALGRLLDGSDDETPGEHPVAVLGYGYWENHQGRDPGVLHRPIVINGQPLTIVGVAPKGFDGTTLGSQPDAFVPLSMKGTMEPGWDLLGDRRAYWTYVFGRLRPGVGVEQASAALNSLYSGIINEVEVPLNQGLSVENLARFRQKRIILSEGNKGQSTVREPAGGVLQLLFAVTGIVLFISCANIANLLLARGTRRKAEMAIRSAMGASRSRLLRSLMAESLVLAALGGLVSLLVAYWTLSAAVSMLPVEAPQLIDLSPRPAVFVFAAILSLGTGILFGIYPALQSTRAGLMTALKSESGQSTGGRGAARFRAILVTAQIAMSMALLVTAGLFVKSLVNVSRVDLGLDTDNLVTFGLSPERNGYGEGDARALFMRAEEELSAVPGVIGVSAASVPVLSGSTLSTTVSVQGYEEEGEAGYVAYVDQVGPGYFSLMGIPLIAGREFTAADYGDSPKVAVVNEAFARRFNLNGREAVGSWMATQMALPELDIQIVGVVRDSKHSAVKGDTPPLFYQPYRQGNAGRMNLYVRTGLDPEQLIPAIRSTMRGLDANLPIEALKTLDQQVRDRVFGDRTLAILSGTFAVLATVLALIGLYGVLAYTVAQRTREIGLRMALGADAGHVRRMVLGRMGRMVIAGGIIGVLAALAVGRAAQSLLFGMSGNDPVVVVTVVVLLSSVALGAGFLPARRASRIEPMDALRHE